MRREFYLCCLLGLLTLPIVPTVAAGQAKPEKFFESTIVRALPGSLDTTAVFNSNSPEVVQTEGILLSTFPPDGMKVPSAHLDYQFDGRFDLFLHHINNSFKNDHTRTLYIGVIMQNRSDKTVHLKVLEAASYLSQPDSPFKKMDALLDNSRGHLYAGPGDRVMNDFLRHKRSTGWPERITIPPHQYYLLLNLPIPDDLPKPHINGRSTLIKMKSDGPVCIASLGMFGPADGAAPLDAGQHANLAVVKSPSEQSLSVNLNERPPRLDEYVKLLQNGDLCGPRDTAATAPGRKGKFAFGRVAGVDQGTQWNAELSGAAINEAGAADRLHIAPGQAFSFPINTVVGGTFGTKQVQAAPMLRRYPDTAYAAHGNYGVHYRIRAVIDNNSFEKENVVVSFDSPIKADKSEQGLEFFEKPEAKVFYRGSVGIRYRKGVLGGHTRFIHLVENRGQSGFTLADFNLTPGRKERVEFDLFYPPDATPPQVLTIKATVAGS